MTTDPKFQPLVDDLKNWLELEKQKETAKAAGLNSVVDAFRPTANYLEQLGKELKNNVDQTISIGLIGRWKEGPDQKFSVRYEVNFKGQVCHALLFNVQGRQIRIDDHVFVVGDQSALEETLGKTIVEAIKREASRAMHPMLRIGIDTIQASKLSRVAPCLPFWQGPMRSQQLSRYCG